jgi:hypothetical protein
MNIFDELSIKPKQSIFSKIKSAIVYAVLADVPPCGSYRDQWHGDYDCKYSPDFECEQCVCVDYWIGIDPTTGLKFKKLRRHFR